MIIKLSTICFDILVVYTKSWGYCAGSGSVGDIVSDWVGSLSGQFVLVLVEISVIAVTVGSRSPPRSAGWWCKRVIVKELSGS